MSRKSIPPFDLNAFSGPFRAETDRACAVLGAALLDARLEILYKRRMRRFQEDLLSNNGALGTFSARIRVARALAWISDDAYHDLDLIRKIRNEFAHNFDHALSFQDQSIASMCRELLVAKVLIEANEFAASRPHRNLSARLILAMGEPFRAPRQRFEIAVEMLAQHLDQLPGESDEYNGPNLREDLWALGSEVNIKFSATAFVGPVSPNAGEPEAAPLAPR